MAITAEDIDLAADRELVERWQAGEHEVFDDLYRRYFTRLRSYCQRRVGDRDTAEEIAQEAFVKALQALPRFAGDRRFYPWVTVIASRLCVDHHRRLGRVRPTEDVDPGSVDGDHGERLAFLADVDNLDRALQRLGPRHLEVLELRERKGMSYAEIADHLAVPQTTVEALLFRARRALRREFMAIAGDSRLAALPVVGAIVRRLAAVRDRALGDLPALAQLTGPVAAGAMAALVTAIPLAATEPSVPPAPLAPPAIVRVVTTPDPAPATEPPEALLAPPAATPAPAPSRPSDTPVPGVENVGADEARSRAAGMPVRIDLGPVGIGLDPSDPLGWRPSDQDQEDR